MTQHPPHPQQCIHYDVCSLNNALLREYLPKGKVSILWCEDGVRMSKDGQCPHTTPASHQRIEQAIKEINDLLPVWHYYSPPTIEISFEKVKKIRSKLALLREGDKS